VTIELTNSADTPEHAELRRTVRILCEQFGEKYWQQGDFNREYPEQLVDTLTKAGYVGVDSRWLRRRRRPARQRGCLIRSGQMKIVELDVQILTAPNDGPAYWVSNFIVPRANELLVRIRTRDGVEGFGLATSYSSAEPMIQAFKSGIADLVLGEDA
jgi:hypothetical protein